MKHPLVRLLVACSLLLACKEEEPQTQVMVVIDAERSVRSQVFDVDISVKSGQGDVSTWSPRYEMSLTQGSGAVPWPLEVALIPRDGDTSRNYLVVATARNDSGGVLAEVRAISGYVEGRSLSLPLVFDAACLEREDLCGPELTCRAGDCYDPFVEPSTLLPFHSGYRPGDDLPTAGEGGSSGESGSSGEGGTTSDASVIPDIDGAIDACPGEPKPCEVKPMIECNDERCAGCPENFLRVDDERCAPLLIGVGLSMGELAPALGTDERRYSIVLPLLTDSITVSPLAPAGATIEVDGDPLNGSSFTANDLPIGDTTFVLALHAAGHDTRTYTLIVSRGGGQRSFLKAHNTGAGDKFGHAVAMEGDTIVIGAPGEDSSSKDRNSDNNLRQDSGAAYVMVRRGASYEQVGYLKASTILEDGALGTAVAIEDDVIAVGAPDEAAGGSVYVFRRGTAGDWAFETRLTPSQASSERRFGASLALRGGVLAVGAPGDDAFGTDSGAAYVYTSNGTSWSAATRVGPDVPQPLMWFGSGVAVQGDELFVGSTGESHDIYPRGAVHAFVRDGDGYDERQKIIDADRGPLDFYGEAIVIDGDTLVIGAPGASGAATGSGLIHVYMRTDAGWDLEQRLGATNPGADALFGRRLALVNGVIITGAPADDSGGQGIDADVTSVGRIDSGAGYAFARSGAQWSQLALIKAEPPEANDGYGFSVASDGETLVFGAPTESSMATGVDGDATLNGAEGSGAVYVVR
jgi:hypothetical protein